MPISEKKIMHWMSKKRLFFIVSTGRTGTQWLAGLLCQCPDTFVEHEPVPVEQLAHKAAVCNEAISDKYIEKFRLKEIYSRVSKERPDIRIYGEVNGALRRHIVPIRKYIPSVKLIHLVRDGRDVVRSVVSRGTFSGAHPVYYDFRPPIVDEYSERWEKLSEFEKACWLWQWENRYMRQHINQRARIEDITSSYTLFKRQILEPLDLHLERAAWKAQTQRPKNVSPKYTLGSCDHWTLEQKDQFVHICGKEMQHYGYKV